MGDCSCVIHPGETHTEHMRRLYTRMYWARAREICDGVAEVIAKSEAGQPITIPEYRAAQHAALAIAAERQQLAVRLSLHSGEAHHGQ